MTEFVAGVDGCRLGWVVAALPFELDGDGVAVVDTPRISIFVESTFAAVRSWCDDQNVVSIGVDMPIGLPVDGNRQADGLARRLLGARHSSFFPTPAHAVLTCESWDEALAASRRACGKGITKQAFHLMPKVREVRASISPGDQPRFSEVHPETSFAAMATALTATAALKTAGSQPLESKKTEPGRRQRQDLLVQSLPLRSGRDCADEHWWLKPPSPDPGPKAAQDDTLDALAAAWTALRMATGEAMVLGAGQDLDGYALTVTV